MHYIIGYTVGLIVAVPVGALIVNYATSWIAGFRPRYVSAVLSTAVAYLAVIAIGLGIGELGGLKDAASARGLQLLTGLGALSCTHVAFLKSATGESLAPAKAIFVAVLQIVGTVIVLFTVLFTLGAVVRAFR